MDRQSRSSPFHLTPQEVKKFLQLVQAHRSPQTVARRARIVLAVHAHPTWSSEQIAQGLDINDRLVRKWRRRGPETHSLKDAPRSGAPRRFSSEVCGKADGVGLQSASLSWSPTGPLESGRTKCFQVKHAEM